MRCYSVFIIILEVNISFLNWAWILQESKWQTVFVFSCLILAVICWTFKLKGPRLFCLALGKSFLNTQPPYLRAEATHFLTQLWSEIRVPPPVRWAGNLRHRGWETSRARVPKASTSKTSCQWCGRSWWSHWQANSTLSAAWCSDSGIWRKTLCCNGHIIRMENSMWFQENVGMCFASTIVLSNTYSTCAT